MILDFKKDRESRVHPALLKYIMSEEPSAEKATETASSVFDTAIESGMSSLKMSEAVSTLKVPEAESAAEGGEYTESANAKKSVSDILAADSSDESLRRYKESLLGAAAAGDLGNTSDPRRVIVTEFRIIFEEGRYIRRGVQLDPSALLRNLSCHNKIHRTDMVFNLDTPEGLANLKKTGVTIKEGAKYRYKISFRVQHDIVAGIKFVNKVKTSLLTDKEELMIGSYPPASTPHVFEFPRFDFIEAPSGMMYRGSYTVKNQFISSDKVHSGQGKL
jgi:Rho GDP-dissociation inhibitor